MKKQDVQNAPARDIYAQHESQLSMQSNAFVEMLAKRGLIEDDLDTLINLVNSEIDLDNYRLENRIQSMRLSRSMMDRLNEAVSILRDKPQNGDMLYNIIYLTYIAPERLMVVEICSKLHISDRQYYRLRQQALNIISIRLWSAPAAELDSWIEVMSLLEVL